MLNYRWDSKRVALGFISYEAFYTPDCLLRPRLLLASVVFYMFSERQSRYNRLVTLISCLSSGARKVASGH